MRLGGLERQEVEASRKHQDQRDELGRREAELEQSKAVVASLQGTINEQQQRLAGQASKCVPPWGDVQLSPPQPIHQPTRLVV